MSTPRKVFVVDDDEGVREALSESLEDAGYDVSVAPNGAAAIRALRARASSDLPGLVLLDLMMPVMDGEQFLQEMRNDPRLSALPVVILTADGNAFGKAARLGVSCGLPKPVRLDDLLSTVSEHCLPT